MIGIGLVKPKSHHCSKSISPDPAGFMGTGRPCTKPHAPPFAELAEEPVSRIIGEETTVDGQTRGHRAAGQNNSDALLALSGR